MIFDVDVIENLIGYTFKDKMLLRRCFTHSSYAHELKMESNEKLEFFGDAIIEFIVTEYLIVKFAGDEGALTERRKNIVSNEVLAKISKNLGLHKYLMQASGQGKNDSYVEKKYASLIEALVAGIYIDGGIKETKKFLKKIILTPYEERQNAKIKTSSSAKKDVQEYVQKKKLGSIGYVLLSQIGPDHMPEFRVGLTLNNSIIAEGKGNSKKKAEESAAKKALEKLK